MLTPALDAIAKGVHGNPFEVLGPHADATGKGFTVRCFLPQAVSVQLLAGTEVIAMEKVHPGGIFAAPLPKRPERYQFSVTLFDGTVTKLDDAYRFGTIVSPEDLHLHGEARLLEAWKVFGARTMVLDGVAGVLFVVWAPNADVVSVVGEFNEWDGRRHAMRKRDGGVWEIFIPGAAAGDSYKYRIRSVQGGEQLKCDPFAAYAEVPPKSASIVWDLDRHDWQDAAWLQKRGATNWLEAPMSIYEVHLESWRRHADGTPLSYRELAVQLVDYVKQQGYTHIELMPILEHPFTGSWGYQVTGFFAPTSRFGTPEDFKYFVDCCHQAGIAILLDWVPGHFPKDGHGLATFDGTSLYEHSDPRQGEHKDWGTLIFNYGRNEVRNFLLASALFWLKEYHLDGLRVDAVASMLYLDYSREPGEWIPNKHGGRENIDAISFLQAMNEEVHKVPGAVTIAEESTSYQGVSRPVYAGGLGFTMKWNMGWMHDMFAYFKQDPIYRKFHQNSITFSMLYAFTENFVLPISHDEVVHGKGSLIGKMPGDEWRKFANVRAFMAYMFAHPGKKLLFMGQDFGQFEEWNEQASLRWDLLQYDPHRKLNQFVAALNHLYTAEPALWEVDFSFAGFDWVDFRDVDGSVIAFNRKAKDPQDWLLVICNFTPVVRTGYRIGVHQEGGYRELLNSDSHLFGGSNQGNMGYVQAENIPSHGRPYSLSLTLPPLGVVYMKGTPNPPPGTTK